MKLIKKTLKWIVVAFFASTILSVVALRFIPVMVTPLMLIRCYQQVKAGEKLYSFCGNGFTYLVKF